MAEVEHTSPDPVNEIPVIAEAHSGERIYMLLRREDLERLLK